jgi:alkaline phosphatase
VVGNTVIPSAIILRRARILPPALPRALLLMLALAPHFAPAPLLGQEKPENIILLVGDGMGLAHVSAQLLATGHSALADFPVAGFSITSSASSVTTESAAGASALSTGHKVANGFVAMDSSGEVLPILLYHARIRGKSTGVVVTSSVTHATPAAFLAHARSRKNEFDIASAIAFDQLADVLIGGGRRFFLPESRGGARRDGKDLLAWMRQHGGRYDTSSALNGFAGQTERICLMADEALPAAGERPVPLAVMVDSALQCLAGNNHGFVLVVEGSQIDWAAHDNDCRQLLRELDDFDGAVAAARAYARAHPSTLVVALADHETGGLTVTDDGGLRCLWSTTEHTPCMVPVFACGPGAERFGGIHQNDEIGRILASLVSR